MLDREIILKIKNGEIDYYAYLVKKYTILIYRYIKAKIYNQAEVDDLVQNTFINFYKAIHRFDEDRPVPPYLYQIASNEMKMYFRSRKRTVPLDERSQVLEENVIPLDTIQSDLIAITEKLPQEQKKALQLLADGYSYQEVARQLKRPLNTVRSIIRRARLNLTKKKYEKS